MYVNREKLLFAITAVLFILSGANAYDLGVENAPLTECNDNEDNDNDGKIDENDPGCTIPYYQDDSEGNIFDLDATNVFANIDPDDSDSTIRQKLLEGPSIYYGWNVTSPDPPNTEYYPDSSFTQNGNTFINETWIVGAKQDYGGGNITSVAIDTGEMAVSNARNPEMSGVVDTPGTGTGDECGDGVQQEDEVTHRGENENYVVECPEDAGLPAQNLRGTGTISEDLGNYSMEGDNGVVHEDNVKYDVNESGGLFVSEYTTDNARCPETPNPDVECDDITDITSDNGKLYETLEWVNVPDFVVREGNSEIYAVHPNTSTVNLEGGSRGISNGRVENDVLKDTKSKDNYTSDGVKHFGCSPSENCTDGEDYCTSVSSESVYDYAVEEVATTLSFDANEYETAPDRLDYQVEEESVPMSIRVSYNDRRLNSTYYQSCSGTETSKECDGDCTLSNEKTVYTANSFDYQPGYNTYTKDYNIESIFFSSHKIFDLDPEASNPIGVEPKNALFNNDYDTSNVIQRSHDEKGWFSYEIPFDDKDQGNDYSVTLANFGIITNNNEDFISFPSGDVTYDVDGRRGFGDGFVAISEGQIVGSTNSFLDMEITDNSSANYVTVTDAEDDLDLSCPGDTVKCVASVDVSLKNYDAWDDSDPDNPSSGVQFHITENGPYRLSKSYGTAKMYKALTNDPSVTTDNNEGPISDDDDDVCGDVPGERYIHMEGPEIDEELMEEKSASTYGLCIDTSKPSLSESACNFKNNPVPEGYVGDVAPGFNKEEFEEGGNSPDMEVCLDLEDTGIGDEGDEIRWDNKNNDRNQQDYGGEWYDLDSEMAQEYIRGVESGSYETESGDKLISDGDPEDTNDIAYYWSKDVNPPLDEEFNPQGGRSGTALEDDCGNPRFDELRCDDQNDQNDRGHGATDTFYSFFNEELRDEDFQPQGESTESPENLDRFDGRINRLQSLSDQLQPSMASNAYSESDYTIWEDTRGGEYADIWAISASKEWSIDSTGTPYPPYSTWYREPSDTRTSPDSESVEKMEKAFGNSYAAVANESFTYNNIDGEQVEVDQGDGIWIDPDQIKEIGDRMKLNPDASGWRAALSMDAPRSNINNGFKIDLTGPDAGLGIDVDGIEECLSARDDGGCKVVAEEVDWEKDDSGDVRTELEEPVCGDDRQEYLIEQAGEIDSSEQYTGPYACSSTLNTCYDANAPEGEKLTDQSGYRDVEEPGEDEGRFKDDREICQKIEGEDDYTIWYDQDYREDFCRQNTIYGTEGVRWFDKNYVAKYPQAVRGGIDDSWNEYLSQQGHRNYTSDTSLTSSEVSVDGSKTPVSTGTFGNVTATLGFCGGDDESEYLVTQKCNTPYCETDRTVQGVAKVPGSCVLKSGQNTRYETDVDERSIFRPGERVELTNTGVSIACFNGAWFSDWPINFNQDEVTVPLGETRSASFSVVNIRNTETTFRVSMLEDTSSGDNEPSAEQFAEFASSSGDSFTTTVDPTSSKSFRMEFTGGREDLDDELTVQAEAINAGISGSDSIQVDVGSSTGGGGGAAGQTEEVPGIQSLQVLMLVLFSTLVYFRQ